MTGLRSAVAILVLGMATAVSGCGKEKPELQADSPIMLPIDRDTPTATEGRDFTQIATIPDAIDGRISLLLGVAEDGTQFFEQLPIFTDPSQPEDPKGSVLVARNPKTEQVHIVAQHGTTNRWIQISGATVTGTQIAWIETPSTSLFSEPWDLYLYDLKTETTKHIASSDHFGIENPPMTWLQGIMPLIENDFIYFPAVDEVRDSDPPGLGHSSVYRVPISGGDPELVAKGAIEVFSDLDGTLHMRFPDMVVAWDPKAGGQGKIQDTILKAPNGSFANEGVRVVVDQTVGVRIFNSNGQEIVVSIPDVEGIFYPNATDRWVSFTVANEGEQQAYIVDLERDVVMLVKDAENSSMVRHNGNVYTLRTHVDDPSKRTTRLIALLPE